MSFYLDLLATSEVTTTGITITFKINQSLQISAYFSEHAEKCTHELNGRYHQELVTSERIVSSISYELLDDDGDISESIPITDIDIKDAITSYLN